MIKPQTPFTRDVKSKALINRDTAGLQKYREQRKLHNKIDELEKRVAQLEQMIRKE